MTKINLNEDQRQAAESEAPRIAVIAGAGTGKTATLTARIAYLVEDRQVDPRAILALTFTNKAAREMRLRVEQIIGPDPASKLQIGTFHSQALRWLRLYLGLTGLPLSKQFTVFDPADAEIVLDQCRREIEPKLTLRKLLRCRATYQETIRDDHPKKHESWLRIWREYHRRMFSCDAIDFDSIIELFQRACREESEIVARHARRFQHVLVDEFQDTDLIQWRIVRSIFAWSRTIGASLFLVGDWRQAIYGFRGASTETLATEVLGGQDWEVHRLARNYRSTVPIVEAANRIERWMGSPLSDGPGLTTDRPGLPVELLAARDKHDQAERVVSQILDYTQGGLAPRDIGVLFRAHSQAIPLKLALDRESIPYHHVGGQEAVWDTPHVRAIVRLLRLASNPRDDQSLTMVLGWPRIRLTTREVHEIELRAIQECVPRLHAASDIPACQDLRDFCSAVQADTPLATALSLVDQGFRPSDAVDKPAERDRFHAGWNLLIDWIGVQEQPPTVSDFLGWFAARRLTAASAQDLLDDRTDQVTLATVHGAKGLEWPVVFLLGCVDGKFPIHRADTDLAEERRVFYVAATRAKESLCLCHYSMERNGMAESPVNPSPFLTELTADPLSAPPGA
uniref:DNA 3'-5' helicase n=1 Tax=viral metagenome TaxID=1070528 RepID=A0A6M3M8H8_9ZZZZ